MTTGIKRRDFIRGGLFIAAGVSMPTLLGACGNTPPRTKTYDSLASLIDGELSGRGAKQTLQVFLGGEDFVVGLDNRLPLGLVDLKGNPVAGKTATVWAAPRGGDGKPIGPFEATWAGYAKPEASPAPQGVNAPIVRLDQTGPWQLVAAAELADQRIWGTAAFQVKTRSDTRMPGEKAIPSQTPTVDNHRGVQPICTRTPPCDMHKVTLANALTLGKPAAFIVATPRFCMSRTCGPNLEELIMVEHDLRDRVTFVHAEVYRDDKADDIARQVTSPTFNQWRFQSDPWLFLIDRGGVIRARFEGPVTAPTIGPALESLLS